MFSLIIFPSFFSYLEAHSNSLAPTRFLVTRVGPCYDSPKTVTVSEMSLDREKYDIKLSGHFNVTEDLENGWSIMATMQKCHDIRNLDTCDFFRSFPVLQDGCAGATELSDIFARYVTPKLSCPIKADSYNVSEFPLFSDGELTAAESKISTSVFGYTYRLEGFNQDNETVLCVDAYLKLQYIRVHDWLGAERRAPTTKARSPALLPPTPAPAFAPVAPESAEDDADDPDDE